MTKEVIELVQSNAPREEIYRAMSELLAEKIDTEIVTRYPFEDYLVESIVSAHIDDQLPRLVADIVIEALQGDK